MWVLIFFALNVHAQSPWLWKKLSKPGNFVLVSDQYSDTINSRTHTQKNKPCRQLVIPWKRRLSPLNLTTQRWTSLLLDAIECSSPKHSIIGYESCIFGRCFLFFSEASFWQDFLYHQEAMNLIFLAVAALSAEWCCWNVEWVAPSMTEQQIFTCGHSRLHIRPTIPVSMECTSPRQCNGTGLVFICCMVLELQLFFLLLCRPSAQRRGATIFWMGGCLFTQSHADHVIGLQDERSLRIDGHWHLRIKGRRRVCSSTGKKAL